MKRGKWRSHRTNYKTTQLKLEPKEKLVWHLRFLFVHQFLPLPKLEAPKLEENFHTGNATDAPTYFDSSFFGMLGYFQNLKSDVSKFEMTDAAEQSNLFYVVVESPKKIKINSMIMNTEHYFILNYNAKYETNFYSHCTSSSDSIFKNNIRTIYSVVHGLNK